MKKDYTKKKKLFRLRQIKNTYNITESEYNNLFRKQKGKCAICKRNRDCQKRDFAVDHNHTTGKVRGLLCGTCNSGIGLLQDNIILLKNAIKYLRRYP